MFGSGFQFQFSKENKVVLLRSTSFLSPPTTGAGIRSIFRKYFHTALIIGINYDTQSFVTKHLLLLI